MYLATLQDEELLSYVSVLPTLTTLEIELTTRLKTTLDYIAGAHKKLDELQDELDNAYAQ